MSVPHTGTTFCQHYLSLAHAAAQRHYEHVSVVPGKLEPRYPEQDGYCLEHVLPQMMHKIRHWAARYPILVPLRHPLRVAASWHAKGKRVTDSLDYWRRLMAVAHAFRDSGNLYYLPVDRPGLREPALERFGWRIDLAIPCDWKVVKSTSSTYLGTPQAAAARLSPNERLWVGDLMAEYDWFFRDFYPADRPA